MHTRYSALIVISLILLIPGMSSEVILSMENSFTDRWNNGDVALPGPGIMAIPKGAGILTTTITIDPFSRAGTINGPNQVRYTHLGSVDETPDPGVFLGSTYYQSGTTLSSGKGASDGLPLTIVSRYFTYKETDTTIRVQITPVIVVNTNHQLANRVTFKASWIPVNQGRAAESGCDISGAWNTTWGTMLLSDSTWTCGPCTLTGRYIKSLEQQGTLEGRIAGLVFAGTWTEKNSANKDPSGRFTIFIRDDCCAFTGTYGTGESDINGGEWSGIRT